MLSAGLRWRSERGTSPGTGNVFCFSPLSFMRGLLRRHGLVGSVLGPANVPFRTGALVATDCLACFSGCPGDTFFFRFFLLLSWSGWHGLSLASPNA